MPYTMQPNNYYHLCLGCDVITNTGITLILSTDNLQRAINEEWKLCLRRLSNMTEEEKREYNIRKQRKGFMAQVHADNTLWLLSKHFDLFGLIDAGLAIDKTKM